MINNSTAAKGVLGSATTAALLAMGSSGRAEARDPAYVGKWAKTTAACRKPSDAPTVLKARSYDQFETLRVHAGGPPALQLAGESALPA